MARLVSGRPWSRHTSFQISVDARGFAAQCHRGLAGLTVRLSPERSIPGPIRSGVDRGRQLIGCDGMRRPRQCFSDGIERITEVVGQSTSDRAFFVWVVRVAFVTGDASTVLSMRDATTVVCAIPDLLATKANKRGEGASACSLFQRVQRVQRVQRSQRAAPAGPQSVAEHRLQGEQFPSLRATATFSIRRR